MLGTLCNALAVQVQSLGWSAGSVLITTASTGWHFPAVCTAAAVPGAPPDLPRLAEAVLQAPLPSFPSPSDSVRQPRIPSVPYLLCVYLFLVEPFQVGSVELRVHD